MSYFFFYFLFFFYRLWLLNVAINPEPEILRGTWSGGFYTTGRILTLRIFQVLENTVAQCLKAPQSRFPAVSSR